MKDLLKFFSWTLLHFISLVIKVVLMNLENYGCFKMEESTITAYSINCGLLSGKTNCTILSLLQKGISIKLRYHFGREGYFATSVLWKIVKWIRGVLSLQSHIYALYHSQIFSTSFDIVSHCVRLIVAVCLCPPSSCLQSTCLCFVIFILWASIELKWNLN